MTKPPMVRKRASVNDLPNELLTAIFRLLYEMHRKIASESQTGTSKESWVGDPFDPFMFPFAQTKVCKRWRTLLAYHPTYWTRIPIVVGLTPLEEVVSYFRWSQDLLIEVALESDADAELMEDDDMELYVAPVLAHISRNLHRMANIRLSLASIEDPPHWLVGQADTASISSRGCCSSHRDGGDQHFSMPELVSLSIDSQTFDRAYSVDNAWLANAPKLRGLSLTPPEAYYSTEDLSMEATIDALSHVKQTISISIRDVHFDDDYEFDLSSSCHVSAMTFEDLGDANVAAFTDANENDLSHLTIKNCSALDFQDLVINEVLSLEDLDRGCDLTNTFTDLSVDHTIFRRCAAFNDGFLFFMSDGGCTGREFPARGMRSLTLIECTSFSVEALCDMVLTRRTAKEEDLEVDGTMEDLASDDLDDLGAIMRLEVTGGPFLSQEYRAKFEQAVPEFIWTNSEDNADDTT